MSAPRETETRLWFVAFFTLMLAYACLLAGLGDSCEARGGHPGLLLPTCEVGRE